MAACSPAGFPTFSQTLRHRAPLPRPTSRGTRREGKGAATHQPQPSTSTSRSYRPSSAFGHCIPLPLHPVARSTSAAPPVLLCQVVSTYNTCVLDHIIKNNKSGHLNCDRDTFLKKNTVWCQGDYVRICVAASLSWL